MSLSESARRIVVAASEATAGAANEASLRHAIEMALERECRALGFPWTPYRLDFTLRNVDGHIGFADVVHGAVVIEYEPPSCFGGIEGATLRHAQRQAEEYATSLASEEGRPLEQYVIIAWDGRHISFGRMVDSAGQWERLGAFGQEPSERLLRLLRDDGIPLVHPAILKALVGPESPVGALLIPQLFLAAVAADVTNVRQGRQTKTTLLFLEWRRLFGQAIGITTEGLQCYLDAQSRAHNTNYVDNIPAYLYALHTYIATVAKLVAAFSLPRASQDMADSVVPLRQRMRVLESGRLFRDSGIANMLNGDFFSWYVDDARWPNIEAGLSAMVSALRGVSFDLTHKRPESVRDLFKGLYEVFVPRELRHALGEVYTPDWLAEHAFDEMGWLPENDLLDPTCGTGTFLLEAIRRRMVNDRESGGCATPERVLKGIWGIDLNPLAVLGAKASIVVVLGARLDSRRPIVLPVFLADAINSAEVTDDGFFEHKILTELGRVEFRVPESLVRSPLMYGAFDRIRALIDSNIGVNDIMLSLVSLLEPLRLGTAQLQALEETVQAFSLLHEQGWNGIWAPILADRFAAAAILPVSHIAGNPPWVKWSHLPPAYAAFIKPMCQSMNVFSEATYVGGIESDISTVITFAAIKKWLAADGKLGFFITATVFNNESSQGFRRFEYDDGSPMGAVTGVEDFQALAPFEGVTNHPSLLLVTKGRGTSYPVPFSVWKPGINGRPGQQFPDAASFRRSATRERLLACPVYGSDSGPWLKGTQAQHNVWEAMFDASAPTVYQARKGITTDLNGVYFVRVRAQAGGGSNVEISNDPSIGRTDGLAQLRGCVVEKTHLFPLARGRGLKRFRADLDPEFHVIVPQRGMHGDPTLATSAPRTHGYFLNFETTLRERGSYRRYQAGQPFWSTWSTGPYTFKPYKVLWQEMGGRNFRAAYVGPVDDPILGSRVVVPDHKLYFVPLDTENEAAYLTAFLNAPVVASAVSAYASQLSLGTSVTENLRIPRFDPENADHRALSDIAIAVVGARREVTAAEDRELDRLALAVARR